MPIGKFVAVASALALAACTGHTWAPGPHQSAANFTEVSGRCKLAAIGADNGGGFVYAQGNPQFVGTAVGASVAAGAIGSAVRQQNIFNACMEANGFVVADTAPGVTPVATQDPRVARIKELGSQAKTCQQTLQNEPTYASLKSHLIDIDTSQYTPAQMSDTSFPTSSDSQLLVKYRAEQRTCYNQFITPAFKIVPALEPILTQRMNEADLLMSELINRQINSGQYSQRAQQLIETTKDKVRALDAKSTAAAN